MRTQGENAVIKNICLSLAASTALIAGTAHAASDYLMKIDGIPGTSTMQGFEDYLEVQSWSLGFSRGVCQNLHFVKEMDTSSAELTGATLTGLYYPTVILVARKRGGDGSAFTYMRLTLFSSIFTSFQTGGSNGSSIIPMEQISLAPSSVKFELFEQQGDGSVRPAATNTVSCQKPK
jgi:type VI protein secretion system component Hcp